MTTRILNFQSLSKWWVSSVSIVCKMNRAKPRVWISLKETFFSSIIKCKVGRSARIRFRTKNLNHKHTNWQYWHYCRFCIPMHWVHLSFQRIWVDVPGKSWRSHEHLTGAGSRGGPRGPGPPLTPSFEAP